LFCSEAHIFAQKVTTKVTVYNEIFLTDKGLIALPDNAVELECINTIKSALFKSPLKLALDSKGNIYVASRDNDVLCRYSPDGKPLGQLATGKNGKSFLKGPEDVEVTSDRIVVYEKIGNRVTFLDLHGHKIESRKVPEIEDFAIDEEGQLILASVVETREAPLARISSHDGKIQYIGKPLAFVHSMRSLNSRSIATNNKGAIYMAFRYFPIVRKYSSGGPLLAEYRIESPTMEAKERYNLKAIGEGITDFSQRSQYKALIIEIASFDDSIFLVSHNPRLEISELDETGVGKATYWMDSREIYFASDLAISDLSGERIFYVAHSNPPEYSIDVLSIKRPAPAGLDGDIQKWTAEINLFPENSLAYVNRGMARHLKGDYSEAIIDFSTAISLDPASSVAFNNRGLSRVKMKDYDGAVSDFSRAIELDPKVAAVYFNRGIARIHMNDLMKAIGDFETAAKMDGAFEARAKEQIDYCRSRLGK